MENQKTKSGCVHPEECIAMETRGSRQIVAGNVADNLEIVFICTLCGETVLGEEEPGAEVNL
jgi:hypothetical protein